MKNLIQQVIEAQHRFRNSWDEVPHEETTAIPINKMESVLSELEERLKNNYPFYHPRYAAQMMKPPHEIAVAAYLMAMQINPNNHALDGGPATAKMELEVIQNIAHMFGYKQHLGHLTSSGTIANLEALWIARSIHPEKAIAFSSSAHYTHSRMCRVLGIQGIEIPVNDNHTIDLNALEQELKQGTIGTVVATLGTTGVGALDKLQEIIPLCKKYGVRVHADCAYGGFFTLLARNPQPIINAEPFLALPEADSIVVDPHKHGLQPYGCGCIVFKDPTIGKYYKHDSPYTYFTSKDLHLGEISLECSRAGAAAAALWATLQCFPLQHDKGLGMILQKTRRSALLWNDEIKKYSSLATFVQPQLDIVTYFPVPKNSSATKVSLLSEKIFHNAMNHSEQPVYLAKFIVDSSIIKRNIPSFELDQPQTTILRSVLMKPEHFQFISQCIKEIAALTEE